MKTIKIWEKEDFFSFLDGGRKDMDPVVVQCHSEPVPVSWNFDWQKPPIALVSNIRIEDGELLGEIEWLETTKMNDELMDIIDRDFRFGGYYTGVHEEKRGDEVWITDCVLRGVGVILKQNMPGFKGHIPKDVEVLDERPPSS